ncbi:triose-phosphate isomerase [Candidatus Uhrbacteria bacterium]|nr:triose-phosphate isomerase [Candidatus Uhrbacteria bacterium]
MKPITIIANWKMNLTLQESIALAEAVEQRVRTLPERISVLLCPSFTALPSVQALVRTCLLGAQDVFWEERGAYTGEIAPRMLRELGCRAVIIGHSERRAHCGETDAMVRQKVAATIAAGLIPIVCVGETRAERDEGKKEQIVHHQVVEAFSGKLSGTFASPVYIAYEPVWAIGSGNAVEPTEAEQMHALILHALRESFSQEVIDKSFRVLYGGSVDRRNVAGLLAEPHIAGCLVGGASQNVKDFCALLEAVTNIA